MIFSYTLINTFHEVCPRQAHERFWLKSVPFVETPELKAGMEDHKALEKYFKYDTMLPPRLAHMETMCAAIDARGIPLVEHKMGVTREMTSTGFFDSDCYIRSVADIALYAKDNTSVFIADWKTGKKREYGEPLQLMILAASSFAYYPQLESVTATNIYTKTAEMGDVQMWTRAELPELWRTILPLVHEIEQAEAANNFPERPGPLCGWCGVFKCQHNRNPNRAAP